MLLNVFSKINPLITTYQNMCKNWVFLNFLETGLSQRNDTGDKVIDNNKTHILQIENFIEPTKLNYFFTNFLKNYY